MVFGEPQFLENAFMFGAAVTCEHSDGSDNGEAGYNYSVDVLATLRAADACFNFLQLVDFAFCLIFDYCHNYSSLVNVYN